MVLLEVHNLKTYFKVREGWVKAVDNVSLPIEKGETVGLVGESGCGKTTLGYSVIQLLPNNAFIKGGSVLFHGEDLIKISLKKNDQLEEYHPEIIKMRWKKISMIFQGAMNAFNPVYKVGDQIIEAIKFHEDISTADAKKRVEELFKLVGVSTDRIDNYPHEYSGGMRQRAMIAMALALNPDLIIADEPTTALDVITQDKILGKISELQKELDIAMMIISHDVSIVSEVAQKIAVMYAGKLVEMGTTRHIFKKTAHPYTEGLLGSFPSIIGEKKRLPSIPGFPPSLLEPPSGCIFHPRCKYAKDICRVKEPLPIVVDEGHSTVCHFGEELYGKLKRGVK